MIYGYVYDSDVTKPMVSSSLRIIYTKNEQQRPKTPHRIFVWQMALGLTMKSNDTDALYCRAIFPFDVLEPANVYRIDD